MSGTEILGVLLNLALVIIGCLALHVYGGQLEEMQKTNSASDKALQETLKASGNALQETLRKMQDQVDATKSQTNQAADATKDATDAQVRLSRPFITPTKTTIVPLDIRLSSQQLETDAEGKKYAMILQQWDDTGSSRAEHVTIRWTWSREQDPKRSSYQTAVRNYTMNEKSGILDWLKIPLTELDRLRESTPLYLYTVITYRDILPDTKNYKTHVHTDVFCFILRRYNPVDHSIESTSCSERVHTPQ